MILFALLIIAVAGSVGLVVSFALCKLFKISEFEMLSRIGRKVLGMFQKRIKHRRIIRTQLNHPALTINFNNRIL